MERGDVVFFRDAKTKRVCHVVPLHIGGGKLLHIFQAGMVRGWRMGSPTAPDWARAFWRN
jgi:hypothetical protein